MEQTKGLVLICLLVTHAGAMDLRHMKFTGTECTEPCMSEDCERLKMRMEGWVDMSVDPCEDFFRFSCNANTRGTLLPPAKKPLLPMEKLVKNPPEGFDYVERFYQSCTRISTGYSSLEILYKCTADGTCSDEELAPYGPYLEFVQYLKKFTNKTAFPLTTPNWEEVTKSWFGGQGWNWWDFAAKILTDNFYLGAFQYVQGKNTKVLDESVDIFRANLFFVPMIETTIGAKRLNEGDLLPRIHIVPMKVSSFLRKGGDATKIEKYKHIMKTLLGFLGANATTLNEDVNRIVELELELGEINDLNQDTSCENSWEMVTITDLYKLVPSVEWRDYIQATLQSNPDFKVRRYTKVAIPGIMKELGDWVKKIETNRRDQANLLIWRMMVMFANNFMHTGTDDTDLQDNIFTKIDPEAKTRPQNCIAQLKTFFPGLEDDMLIAQYVDKETKASALDMFEGLKEEFGRMIQEADWMSQRTKVRAIEKLNQTTMLIGDLLPKTQEFEELKSRIKDNNYIGNIQAIGNYKWDTLSKSLENNKAVNSGYEDENNAYYWSIFNQVRVKTGLITDMLDLGFSLQYPISIIYGGFVASTLGHELIHGFDSNGRKYDKDGFHLDWWEAKDDAAFKKKTQCLVDQYANFPIFYLDQNYTITPYMPGGDTEYSEEEENLCDDYESSGYYEYSEEEGSHARAGENIADNGGVKAAYRTFKRQQHPKKDECVPDMPFNANQLFWLGYAMDWCSWSYYDYYTYPELLSDSESSYGHSPAPWRVNTVLANMPDFAKDYNCPVGSKLNPLPEQTCAVW